jgi:hypothetical protein
MFRIFTVATALVLTAAAAQATESLSSRIHNAAVEACVPESSSRMPVSHYGAITSHCVERISAAAAAKYQVEAEAKTKASTAAIDSN